MAKAEIEISEPYFSMLGNDNTNKQIRIFLIKQAPKEFYSVLTQIVRHVLNGTFCAENSDFCENFENSLYILALPSTNRKLKEKVLLSEPPSFINELFSALKSGLK